MFEYDLKRFFANRLTSTNSWFAVLLMLALIFLHKPIIFTLAIVMFFVPDSTINQFIAKAAPAISEKLEEWKDW